MTQELVLDMDGSLPLREEVFHTLKKAILEGILEPGQRLKEIELSDRLGVSRTPVRDALRMLEADGLVRNLPGRGAVVAPITRSDMDDILEIRSALEQLAVRSACQRISDEQMEQLVHAAREFEVRIGQGDITESARCDEQFHRIIIEATGNRRLIDLLNNLRSQFYRYRLENLKDPDQYGQLLGQHRRLLEAIRSRDADAAAQGVGRHIESQRQAILERLG